jgi:hypothetical protein
MSGQVSVANQRVDRINVSDWPHEMYRQNGTPVQKKADSGRVINKEVERHTIHCPECDIPAVYDEDSEPVCPDCGILTTGETGEVVMVRDAKGAGRLNGQ